MSRTARAGRGAVLVFGESRNDSGAVAELAIAANPRLAGRVRSLPRPTSLTRTAGAHPVRRWVTEIAKAVQAHEAAKGWLRPSWYTAMPADRIPTRRLRRHSGVSWRRSEPSGNRTGARGGTAYTEADSPAIARKIREQAGMPHGSSVSYRRLTDLAVTPA